LFAEDYVLEVAFSWYAFGVGEAREALAKGEKFKGM